MPGALPQALCGACKLHSRAGGGKLVMALRSSVEGVARVRVGIIGLPQTGKSALFGALTGAHGATGGYEGVSLGAVRVPDERLAVLERIFEPQKVTPATIEFEDITGVFAHLSGGSGSGSVVASAREVDVILMVMRTFDASHVPAPLGRVDPTAEYRTMRAELLLADLFVIEKRIRSIDAALKRPGDRDALRREQNLLRRCQAAIEDVQDLLAVEMTSGERKMLRNYSLLTLKPHVCLLNISEADAADPPRIEALEGLEPPPLKMCAELEQELMELEPEDRAAFLEDAGLDEMAAGRVVRECLSAAGMITFFTTVSRELRAWPVMDGSTAREAAGKIHSDMERGFIRAEVVHFDALVEAGSFKEARAQGHVRMEGKDSTVLDGDVITFHFSG